MGKVKPLLVVGIGPQRAKNRSFRFDSKRLPVFSIPPKARRLTAYAFGGLFGKGRIRLGETRMGSYTGVLDENDLTPMSFHGLS